MDELVKQITGRANISEAQARKAVDTVLSFMKKRLPAPVGSPSPQTSRPAHG